MNNYYDSFKPAQVPERVKAGMRSPSDKNSVIQETIEKRYWSIGEVAAMLKVATSKIRFWGEYFEYHVGRSRLMKRRSFTAEDIEFFKVLYNLVEVEGYTLWGAKQQLIKLKLLTDVRDKKSK
jgi:hypothetical protein